MLLRAGGAEPVLLPLTRIAAPLDDEALRAAAAQADRYDWIVFTSVNAVTSLHAALSARGAALSPHTRIAVVGPATAAALHQLGTRAAVIPETFTGAALANTLLEIAPLRGRNVLWPRAEHARTDVSDALRAAGALLSDPIAYRTVAEEGNAAELARRSAAGDIDIITFTAPSAVDAYTAAGAADGVLHAVIGPTTAQALRTRGLAVDIEPVEHTVAALAQAVLSRAVGPGRKS
jgi:uroporphyrinogen-III synthase